MICRADAFGRMAQVAFEREGLGINAVPALCQTARIEGQSLDTVCVLADKGVLAVVDAVTTRAGPTFALLALKVLGAALSEYTAGVRW